jgi:hypothetical protein
VSIAPSRACSLDFRHLLFYARRHLYPVNKKMDQAGC